MGVWSMKSRVMEYEITWVWRMGEWVTRSLRRGQVCEALMMVSRTNGEEYGDGPVSSNFLEKNSTTCGEMVGHTL